MSKLPEIEMIEWVDSCSPRGWTSRADLEGYKPDRVTSIGFVLEDSSDAVTLAPHWASSQVDGVLCIPKPSIVRRTRVQLPKGRRP